MKLHLGKNLAALAAAAALTLSLSACGGGTGSAATPAPNSAAPSAGGTVYKVGICNYVDDASLNQIVANIQSRLETIGGEQGVSFEISYA